MQKIKKRYITLMEIMIVMVLIALVMGVIAYNARGSLDEGKKFKTRQGIERIETILNLEVAKDPTKLSTITTGWEDILKSSPLVKDAGQLAVDGWGEKYTVTVTDNVIEVTSTHYTPVKKE
jgi:type II secretory pathway pseudopilin PulG